MTPLMPLSYSRYSAYQNCPNKFRLMYVDKIYPDEGDNIYFIRGKKIHKQLEDYVIALTKGNPNMPAMGPEASNAIPIIHQLHKRFSTMIPEKQIAVDRDWKESSWFDNLTAYYRTIIDLTCYDDTTAVAIDWKSGKVREYDGWGGQLHLIATIIMQLLSHVKEVRTVYMYVEHKQTASVTFTRADLPKLIEYFEKLHVDINADKDFDPKVNKYCFFCLATKEMCEYKK